MRLLVVCILVLIKFPSIATGEEYGFTFNQNRRSVSIPINVYNNVPIVSVYINNVGPLFFILDTGVRTTILIKGKNTPPLNLEIKNQTLIIGLGGEGPIEAVLATCSEIRLKGITGRRMNLLIIPENMLSFSHIFGFPIHGILGHDLFKYFPIQIDYAKEKIRVYRESNYRISRWHHVTPIHLIDGKPYIEVDLVGTGGDTLSTNLLLDLGASSSLYLNKNYIPPSDTIINDYIGSGLGGELKGYIGRIGSIEISGRFSIKKPVVYYPETPFMTIQGRPIKWEGLIGGEILRRFNMIIDYPSNKLIIGKSQHYSDSFRNNLSGLVIEAHGSALRNFVITYVRPGSVAYKAGIKPGDLIIELNLITHHFLTLEKILDILSGDKGSPVLLKVFRENKIYQARFRLPNDI